MREALKLALEALEVANSCVDGYYIPKGKTHLPEVEQAITAIKEALAQPEQEPKHVATVAEVHMSRYTIEWTNSPLPEGAKLYDDAPQRKPLTNEQILDLNFDGEFCLITDDDEVILDFARLVEAAHGIKE